MTKHLIEIALESTQQENTIKVPKTCKPKIIIGSKEERV